MKVGDAVYLAAFEGVACRIEVIDHSRVWVRMVGDDELHEVDEADCQELDEDDFCPSCGQTECGHR